MCGIAGFIGPRDHALVAAMTDRLVHRGPDDEGFYETDTASLGHRRLSIIDLEHGHQPWSNSSGDVHLVYNGEVYNFRELRSELESKGHKFHTACDTEVVLAAYEEWGTACVERFNGMWAFAVLDERAAKLVLARDHFGIKPLYYAQAGGRVLFASEIKALLADADLSASVDTDQIAGYLLFGLHDHDEKTFFSGVRQVRPATVVTFPLDTPAPGAIAAPAPGSLAAPSPGSIAERAPGPIAAPLTVEGEHHVYWSPRLTRDAEADPGRFREVLERAVHRRLVSDVTVGTCLSGGLDSSSIVCLMTKLRSEHAPDSQSMGERLRTFSAVFDGDPIDEQEYIAPVVACSGAESYFVRPRSEELFDDLPAVVWHQDEPMVSSGPYAQYRVMQLAQGKAKVLLDGQGGDELLAGYVPYQYVYLRQLAKHHDTALLAKESVRARDVLRPLIRRKLSDRRKRVDPARYCKPLVADAEVARRARQADSRVQDDLKLRLAQDLTRYSLPSLLRYEDRNSMAASIESRPPLLDQELVDLVFALPEDAIIRDGWSRWILREALSDLLPERIRLRRKKVGFTTPEMRWLKRERALVQGILRSPSFCSRPYWEGPAVARAFAAACDGRLEESLFFWRVLNAEAWLRVFCSPGHLSVLGAKPRSSLQQAGDAEALLLAGIDDEEAAAWQAVRANAGRHVFACGPDGNSVYGRVPIRTPKIQSGDDLAEIVLGALTSANDVPSLRNGDIVAISEKAVAISQGRSFPVSEVRAGRAARTLSRFVGRTPAGIGLGIPETMQLAIDEAGLGRILAAAAVGAAGRSIGRRGDFYRVAGAAVSAIDGPTSGTLPPYDTHAKLPPKDPDGIGEALVDHIAKRTGCNVGLAVVDANDRGVNVLGSSSGVDRALVAWLFGDNPLGQRSEQTPLCLIRNVGRIRSAI